MSAGPRRSSGFLALCIVATALVCTVLLGNAAVWIADATVTEGRME